MTALVIGNSISRKEINLDKLSGFEIYGCNATDLAMIKEIIESGYNLKNKVYTLSSVNYTTENQVTTLPDQTEELCPSGIRALKLALSNHNKIYMIGMDFTNDNQYSGTPTYGDNWDFSKWLKDINRLISKYKDCDFYRIGAQKRNITPHSNFKEITVLEFTNKFYSH